MVNLIRNIHTNICIWNTFSPPCVLKRFGIKSAQEQWANANTQILFLIPFPINRKQCSFKSWLVLECSSQLWLYNKPFQDLVASKTMATLALRNLQFGQRLSTVDLTPLRSALAGVGISWLHVWQTMLGRAKKKAKDWKTRGQEHLGFFDCFFFPITVWPLHLGSIRETRLTCCSKLPRNMFPKKASQQ